MALRLLPMASAAAIAAAASAPSCNASTFPVNLTSVRCEGLTKYPAASSPADCAAACCAAGLAQCTVWQWCDPSLAAPSCWQAQAQGSACWTGHPSNSNPSGCVLGASGTDSGGWLGGLRSPVPMAEAAAYFFVTPTVFVAGGGGGGGGGVTVPSPWALRHCQLGITSDPGMPSADSYWKPVSSLDGAPGSVSLQPNNFAQGLLGIFNNRARAQDKNGTLSLCAEDAVPPADMSWSLAPSAAAPAFWTLRTNSANASFAGKVLTMLASHNAPCTFNGWLMGDMVVAELGATLVNGVAVVSQSFFFSVSCCCH